MNDHFRIKGSLAIAFWCLFLCASVRLVHGIGADGDKCKMDAHCLNGGSCLPDNEDKLGKKRCFCQEGYSGPRCSRFCPLDCQNGGYCTLIPKGGALGLEEQTPTYDPADYMCKCFGYFKGTLCEIPVVKCGGSGECQNGGTCIDTDAGARECRCEEGFSGDSCQDETILTLEEEKRTWVAPAVLLFLGAVVGGVYKGGWHPKKDDAIEFSAVRTRAEGTFNFKSPQSLRRLYSDSKENLHETSNEII